MQAFLKILTLFVFKNFSWVLMEQRSGVCAHHHDRKWKEEAKE